MGAKDWVSGSLERNGDATLRKAESMSGATTQGRIQMEVEYCDVFRNLYAEVNIRDKSRVYFQCRQDRVSI